MRSTEPKLKDSETNELARIMHRFLSRSDESADLARHATEAPANVLYGTLRRPTEGVPACGSRGQVRMISSVQ